MRNTILLLELVYLYFMSKNYDNKHLINIEKNISVKKETFLRVKGRGG